MSCHHCSYRPQRFQTSSHHGSARFAAGRRNGAGSGDGCNGGSSGGPAAAYMIAPGSGRERRLLLRETSLRSWKSRRKKARIRQRRGRVKRETNRWEWRRGCADSGGCMNGVLRKEIAGGHALAGRPET